MKLKQMTSLAPVINVYGFNIDLSVVITVTLTCIIVFVIAKLATRNLSVDNPGKMQNFLEWVVDFVRGIVGSTMSMKKGKPFVTLALTLIMFIFVGNMLGMPLSIATAHQEPFTLFGKEVTLTADEFKAEGYGEEKPAEFVWYTSPTADPSVTLGLAAMIIILSHIAGATRNTKSYLRGFIQPFPAFLPLNIIGEASKLLTLGMRLFGNVFAGGVMVTTFVMAGYLGILGLVPWMGFKIFIGAIQAFIFTMLSMVYISQQIGGEEN